jgi:hypothetical protein
MLGFCSTKNKGNSDRLEHPLRSTFRTQLPFRFSSALLHSRHVSLRAREAPSSARTSGVVPSDSGRAAASPPRRVQRVETRNNADDGRHPNGVGGTQFENADSRREPFLFANPSRIRLKRKREMVHSRTVRLSGEGDKSVGLFAFKTGNHLRDSAGLQSRARLFTEPS